MNAILDWVRRLAGGKRRAGPPPTRHAFALVACARWEETTIQEWVEYHKSIGFSHIYLYANDDDPTPLFRAVAPYTYGSDPFVTFLHWGRPGEQTAMYLHFLRTFKPETTWFCFLDIDEFFVLKGIDNIGRFMRGYEAQTDCLYFNWVLYGNSGRLRREDGPTLTTCLRRALGPDIHTKLLCRSSAIDTAAIAQRCAGGRWAFHHFLDNAGLPGLRCHDVLLESVQGYAASFPDSATRFISRAGFSDAILNRAYIAHFQFRSEEDFMRRWQRGGFGEDETWRALFETGQHKALLADRNQVYDIYLAALWHRHTAGALRDGADRVAPGENVALHKPSWQSSVFLPDQAEPALSRTAGGGNNGVRTGTYGFHTDYELRPWWIVDLLAQHRIEAVHIYNRRDSPVVIVRANELDVLVSADGLAWHVLWSNPAEAPFGLDGAPLVVTAPPDLACRFLLLRLRGTGYLHLDEVEVYGTAIDPPPPVAVPAGGPVIPGA